MKRTTQKFQSGAVKWCVTGFLLLDLFAGVQLLAQPSEADRKFFEDAQAKAEKGDAMNQYILGVCYSEGKGREKDEVEAVKWSRKAAEQNLDMAQFNLGFSYANGIGVEKNAEEAVKWFRKAAEQNLAIAQFNLGFSYANGNGLEKNAAEAVKWYRKAAEQNHDLAQYCLGRHYASGDGLEKNMAEAVKWVHKAAEQNYARAQFFLGVCYASGDGLEKNMAEAVKWVHKAAEQNLADAQYFLGVCYASGGGVEKNAADAVKWYRKAAEQNNAKAQYELGRHYYFGDGVLIDYAEAVKWNALAAAQGNEEAVQMWHYVLREKLSAEQIAEGQRRAAAFIQRKESPEKPGANFDNPSSPANPSFTGTGFFITDDGYLISNYHVVKNAAKVRLLTGTGLIDASVVKVDAANDLALLKANAEGRMKNAETFRPLPIAASRTVKLGGTVATVGFPSTGLQGFAPKLAKGEVASLAGAADDPRYFQISVPVQPGNSGGALVDARGNVVGIVAAKLSAQAALDATGSLPENVNYAVKSSLLLSFLESVPDVAAKLKEPKSLQTAIPPFEDVVKSAQDAAVLVLVY